MSTNLPLPDIQDSAEATKLYFDQYGEDPLEFSANDVSSAIAFFESRGFTGDAGIATASAILRQAKIEQVPVFKIIDTLKGFDSVQLSALVASILNNNRKSISSLGYRVTNVTKIDASRNIDP
jgi:hypothetical protein